MPPSGTLLHTLFRTLSLPSARRRLPPHQYATEEAEANSFAAQNACLTCTTCSLFNFYAMATSVPWIMGNVLPCCWPICLNSTCKSICRCKPCCILLHLDPPTDLYEVQVQSWLTLKGRLPEILIPGPEVRRLLGYMLDREPGMSDGEWPATTACLPGPLPRG